MRTLAPSGLQISELSIDAYSISSFFLEAVAPNLQSEPVAMVGVLRVLCFPLPFITKNAEMRVSTSDTWAPAGFAKLTSAGDI